LSAPSVPTGTDLAQIRELLVAAQGYAVLGPDQSRIGIFIELDDPDGDRIAIRRDGIFVWRRQVLSLATVAKVLPRERAVVLNVDPGALDEEPEAPSEPAHADGDNWRERITRYASLDESEAAESAAHHLLFVWTSSGYRLVEEEGPAPLPGHAVAVPDTPGSFHVTKVGPSPLPNDDRLCAYLAPD
jgi:hypothetical protein